MAENQQAGFGAWLGPRAKWVLGLGLGVVVVSAACFLVGWVRIPLGGGVLGLALMLVALFVRQRYYGQLTAQIWQQQRRLNGRVQEVRQELDALRRQPADRVPVIASGAREHDADWRAAATLLRAVAAGLPAEWARTVESVFDGSSGTVAVLGDPTTCAGVRRLLAHDDRPRYVELSTEDQALLARTRRSIHWSSMIIGSSQSLLDALESGRVFPRLLRWLPPEAAIRFLESGDAALDAAVLTALGETSQARLASVPEAGESPRIVVMLDLSEG